MLGVLEKKSDMSKAEQKLDAVVIGLGATGLSCVRFLKQQGLRVAVTDTRTQPPCLAELQKQFPDVSFYPGAVEDKLCQRAGQIIVSPGVSLQQPALQAVIAACKPVHGDIELFCQHARAPVVAITGSNGKSTVTTLVAKMASAAGMQVLSGGNLGTPALELLEQPVPQFYVLELSSFQLDSTFSLNAYAGVVLNVCSDHMDRYSDIEQYAQSKQKIYSGDGYMIINKDDARVQAMLESSRKVLTFSVQPEQQADFSVRQINDENWLCLEDEKLITVAELGIKGKHNISNALAAMALGSVMNIPNSTMHYVLTSFHGLPHRCQFVASINEVDWINDSKATNVGASIAAIEGLARPGRIILIAGGDSKGADLQPLLPVLTEHVKQMVLIGADADLFAELVADQVPCSRATDMVEAVAMAQQLAQAGDVVLLAPACASLDMFDNYQQRGDVFVEAVTGMEKH